MTLLLSGLLTLVELNCENLFDCYHDEGKQDAEYTPGGLRRWTRTRFWQKVNNLAQEIASCSSYEGGNNLPDVVALCEVENDSCMLYLTQRSLLRGAGYEYVMTNSADPRGIDVALLYQSDAFRPLCYDVLRPTTPPGQRPTRDILYVKGLTRSLDTLHVFVCHFPSRYGNRHQRDEFRREIAEMMVHSLDSLLQRNAHSLIAVLGDFNETCSEPSPSLLRHYSQQCVTDTCLGRHGALGSYCYQGLWQHIDHIFISLALQPLVVHARVNDAPFLLQEDERYLGLKPFRTFYGSHYQSGGYSDHLPLVVTLRL